MNIQESASKVLFEKRSMSQILQRLNKLNARKRNLSGDLKVRLFKNSNRPDTAVITKLKRQLKKVNDQLKTLEARSSQSSKARGYK